jgi:hypothetical protein
MLLWKPLPTAGFRLEYKNTSVKSKPFTGGRKSDIVIL